METFIIGYMIMNEVAGVAMAIGYVKYLYDTRYFERRAIDKWRKEHSYVDKHFGYYYCYIENAFRDARQKGLTDINLDDNYDLKEAFDEMQSLLAGNCWNVPWDIVDKYYKPIYLDMLKNYDDIKTHRSWYKTKTVK